MTKPFEVGETVWINIHEDPDGSPFDPFGREGTVRYVYPDGRLEVDFKEVPQPERDYYRDKSIYTDCIILAAHEVTRSRP